MPPTEQAVERLRKALRLETPLLALYDTEPGPDFEPTVKAKGHACVFAYFGQWMKGKTLVVERGGGEFAAPESGCPGAQRALGFEKEYPSYMAHFLTDGGGAPMGEGLKATPEIAQEFLDRAAPVDPSGDSILIGPLRLDRWSDIKTVSFLVDPDRLSACMTLAGFRSSDPDLIFAPFSSGCGLLWREPANQASDRPVIGCTDIAMRKYVPPQILCLTVSPARFEEMVSFPDDAFLNREWWSELMKSRGM
jgi:hypothetical protein